MDGEEISKRLDKLIERSTEPLDMVLFSALGVFFENFNVITDGKTLSLLAEASGEEWKTAVENISPENLEDLMDEGINNFGIAEWRARPEEIKERTTRPDDVAFLGQIDHLLGEIDEFASGIRRPDKGQRGES